MSRARAEPIIPPHQQLTTGRAGRISCLPRTRRPLFYQAWTRFSGGCFALSTRRQRAPAQSWLPQEGFPMLAMRDFPVPVHKLSVNELPLRAETAGGKGLEGLMSACFSTASRKIGSEQESAGAVEKTRTSTPVKEQRPQRCASTNSATTASVASRLLVGSTADEKGNFSSAARYFHSAATAAAGI